MDPSQTTVKWFCPAVEPSYNVCSITRVKSRKYRTASFRNKLTSQCKHSNHTTNKAGNLQTTTEIEPGDNIIYQPDAITSWSDGSVLQWAQSFWSHVISVQPKSMSLLLLILVVKWRNKKKTSLSRRWLSSSSCLTAKNIKASKSKNGTCTRGLTIKKPPYEADSLAIFSALAMTSSMPPTM